MGTPQQGVSGSQGHPFDKTAIATCVAVLVVLVAAVVSRTGLVSLPPIYDELYHLIPAANHMTSGEYFVLDGSYDRALLYTQLVGAAFEFHGEPSTFAARLFPSVVPGVLLVAVVFLWARFAAGWIAAAIVTWFLLLWPNGIEVSQYVRFYALQGFCFATAAIVIYQAVAAEAFRPWQRAMLLVPAGILLLIAVNLQVMTLVGVAAIGIWIALVFGLGWLREHVWTRWALVASIVITVAVLASGMLDDTLRVLWAKYTWEPWPPLNDKTFYHRHFRDIYPTFWPLFPLAALIALRSKFLPASFCLILFVTSFIVLSFGGLKNIRYLYGVMPFFFVIWGIALQEIGATLFRYFHGLVPAAFAPLFRVPFPRVLTGLVLAVSLLFVLGANAAFERSLRLIDGRETALLLGKKRWEWLEARDMIDPWLMDGAVIVTTEEMLAIQWLGDFDFTLNKPRFSEMIFSLGSETEPFVVDFRTGRPIAGEEMDFGPLTVCASAGVVISNRPWINSEGARRLRKLAEESGARVELHAGSQVSMLTWKHPTPHDPAGDLCGPVAVLTGSGASARILSGESQPVSILSR